MPEQRITYRKLIAMAREAGLVVTRKGRGAASVTIYPDHSIVRNDVRLDPATRISAPTAAKVLGL